MRPPKSPYASQVVIVHKRSREIHLCIDYQQLNSITVRDAFPLPRIDEALQAVHSSNWFISFDLAQGYLQLAMEEGNIEKTAFRASSSGLYEFTPMPFGLSNAGFFLSFDGAMSRGATVCHLVAIPRRYMYLCPSIEEMLDHVDLVFNRLKEFHLKIKPKNITSLTPVFYSWAV